MVAINDSILNVIAGKLQPALPVRAKEQSDDQSLRRGRRAILNLLPDYDTLNSLIAQAREALTKGIFWDRGSIINIIL
jgi:hypothetical protein